MRVGMIRNVIVAAALSFLPAIALGQVSEPVRDHQKMERVSSDFGAPIKITINPEARISVVLADKLLPPAPCGGTLDLPVKIVNRGFVTARLEVALVGDTPPGVTLDFDSESLKGLPEEYRELHIRLTEPGPVDLTIAFKAHNDIANLGGRNRVHFLMRCREVR